MNNLLEILKQQPVWKSAPNARLVYLELLNIADHTGTAKLSTVKEFQESTGLTTNQYYAAMRVLLDEKHVEKVEDGVFKLPAYKLIATLVERKAPTVAKSQEPAAQNHMGSNQLPKVAQRGPVKLNPDVSMEGGYGVKEQGEVLFGEGGQVLASLRPGQHFQKPAAPRSTVPMAQKRVIQRQVVPVRSQNFAPKTIKQTFRKPVYATTIRQPSVTLR